MSYPWHQSFFASLFLLLTFPSFFTLSFMMKTMSASTPAIRPHSHPLYHVSRQIWWWARCLSLSQCLFCCSSFPPLSLPDIKSTLIRLLLNLWWPRHLTVELHQWLKNTESKWRCNSSGVGPWPLIELKDMGNIVRECEKRDKYWMIGHPRWREVARRGRREISQCKSDFGNT